MSPAPRPTQSLLLLGGGGHARSCIDVIEECGTYRIAGVIDQRGSALGSVLGYPVIGGHEDIESRLAEVDSAIVTVGQVRSPDARILLFDRLRAARARLPVIVSPLGHVARTASIGEGSIVMHGALVNSAAVVGSNCIINSLALVEHDVQIADHSQVSTGARVNGSVTVGRGTFIGSGATVREGVTIGERCVIGAGAVLIHDLPDGAVYVGMP